ncbi:MULTISPECIES: DUF397 domain-containing protein [unclassified Actinomadura]|uniref:DUF397 domain-containing protein n=1 Tax=unclassified Actinomadura TaxID=2626254 RepID=UPI0011F05CBC|nr:DUF397 domain-containing protein [Actinomadura sp. K4S16]
MDRTERSQVVWRKSSRSGGGNCVEIAFDGDSVLMRDSTDRLSAVLSISSVQWLLLRSSLRRRYGAAQD